MMLHGEDRQGYKDEWIIFICFGEEEINFLSSVSGIA